MAYNKHKGVLVFMILYTVLFVFDGIRVFDAPLPSSLTTYLVYTIMFLYGCFLFKSELLKKWEEVRSSKRKFFLGVLKGWLLLVLVTIFFGLLSAILRQVLGLSEQGLNEANPHFLLLLLRPHHIRSKFSPVSLDLWWKNSFSVKFYCIIYRDICQAG